MQDHDVVGIGNAIVDIIGRCDDAFLARFGCTKGSMQLVDAATVLKLYDAMGPAIEISGGSAANTMAGIASFGGKAAFIGKTADDQFGQVFRYRRRIGDEHRQPVALDCGAVGVFDALAIAHEKELRDDHQIDRADDRSDNQQYLQSHERGPGDGRGGGQAARCVPVSLRTRATNSSGRKGLTM